MLLLLFVVSVLVYPEIGAFFDAGGCWVLYLMFAAIMILMDEVKCWFSRRSVKPQAIAQQLAPPTVTAGPASPMQNRTVEERLDQYGGYQLYTSSYGLRIHATNDDWLQFSWDELRQMEILGPPGRYDQWGIPELFGLPSILTLASGRRINLKVLRQYQTYKGLPEGHPGGIVDDMILEWALATARRLQYASGEPYLIEPIRSLGLPRVTCIARFFSNKPARGCNESTLNVVWFQDQFAFPIEPQIVDALRKIEWDAVAVDYDAVP